MRIASKADALAAAKRVRTLPHQGGEFTCMTRMLRSANDKIVPQIPAKAARIVIDVSGDGPDNCNADEPIEKVRDELVSNGVTINGLPILLDTPEDSALLPKAVPGGPHPLEQWYREHVMAGNGSFVLAAQGYSDFERAIRQKFVIEVSGISPPGTSKLALGAIRLALRVNRNEFSRARGLTAHPYEVRSISDVALVGVVQRQRLICQPGCSSAHLAKCGGAAITHDVGSRLASTEIL